MRSTRLQRGVLLAIGLGLIAGAWVTRVAAIEPDDHLREGQDLVERATREIDRRVAVGALLTGDRDAFYSQLRDLLRWERSFAMDSIGARYPAGTPTALLVRDGIADTVAVRLHPLLASYIELHPQELLTPGRQAFELAVAQIPMPPGRFLGFHFVDLAHLYAAQCDTIMAVGNTQRTMQAIDPPGVQEGFLRRLWDLSDLYQQAHATSSEKYFCRVEQEDWLAERLICPKCGRRGMRLRDQRFGMREDTTAVCRDVLYSGRKDQAALIGRILCRHWGHIFDAVCQDRSCGGSYEFSVPLPFYRKMQLEMTRGEIEAPSGEELIRRY